MNLINQRSHPFKDRGAKDPIGDGVARGRSLGV
jgi:hypothetical protein